MEGSTGPCGMDLEDHADPRAVFVDPQWLHENLRGVFLFDCSWKLVGDPRAEHSRRRIADADFFDQDAIAGTGRAGERPLMHMVPTRETFEAAMATFGVATFDRIVLYDTSADGRYATSRLWFLMRHVFKHPGPVYILRGGLQAWEAAGYSSEPQTSLPMARSDYSCPEYHPKLVWGLQEMIANARSQQIQIIDARVPERYSGKAPEPRPVLFQGHIRGAISVPFTELDTAMERMDLMKHFVSYCGSGMTAAIINVRAWEMGSTHPGFLYDGSFAEWGNTDECRELTETPE